MAEKIPQSTSCLVVFRAFLASDGKTPATGKTIAITISKNGATSFSNPNAGATNATEMASGFYKFTLDTTDTNTLGPLAWRGAEAAINDAGDVLTVAKATNAGWTGVPDAVAGAASGLPILGTNTGPMTITGGVTYSNTGGDAFTLTSSGGNGSGLNASGNGTGDGIKGTGGATGRGIHALGGSTSGSGIRAEGQGAGASGINALGFGASGAGIRSEGGTTTAPGALFLGGSTSGPGISVTTTSGDGLSLTPTGGSGLVATGNGSSMHGAVFTGGTAGTSDGFKAVAGTGGTPFRANITGNITGSIFGTLNTVTTLTNDPTGTTTLLGRLTATRAGYLDNLSGGAVPSESQIVTAIATFNPVTYQASGNFSDMIIQAATAADPLSNPVPGAYAVGEAGYVLGNLDDVIWIDSKSRSLTDLTGAELSLAGLADVGQAVWMDAVTRVLTGGDNIVLAKGTGLTGLNDLSAAQVNAEVLDVLGTDTPIDGKTIIAAIRILLALVAGETTGAGTDEETFIGADGSTVRAVVTLDDDNNRVAVTYP